MASTRKEILLTNENGFYETKNLFALVVVKDFVEKDVFTWREKTLTGASEKKKKHKKWFPLAKNSVALVKIWSFFEN